MCRLELHGVFRVCPILPQEQKKFHGTTLRKKKQAGLSSPPVRNYFGPN
jgi:hypothetical protein